MIFQSRPYKLLFSKCTHVINICIDQLYYYYSLCKIWTVFCKLVRINTCVLEDELEQTQLQVNEFLFIPEEDIVVCQIGIYVRSESMSIPNW